MSCWCRAATGGAQGLSGAQPRLRPADVGCLHQAGSCLPQGGWQLSCLLPGLPCSCCGQSPFLLDPLLLLPLLQAFYQLCQRISGSNGPTPMHGGTSCLSLRLTAAALYYCCCSVPS